MNPLARGAPVATWLVLALVLALSGCTSAMPLLAGGATTQEKRGAVTAGGSARIAFGDAKPGDRPDGSFARAAAEGGVVPVAGARYGVARHWDVGLFVAGTDLRLEGRREIVLDEASTRPSILLGAGLLAGYVDDALDDDASARGYRVGVEPSAVWAVEFGPVYDLWMGARLGAEHVRGQFLGPSDAPPTGTHGATTLRAGAVVGLGAGFRRVHAQIELTAYYESWVGAPSGSDLGGGLVLVPAFALRVRL